MPMYIINNLEKYLFTKNENFETNRSIIGQRYIFRGFIVRT